MLIFLNGNDGARAPFVVFRLFVYYHLNTCAFAGPMCLTFPDFFSRNVDFSEYSFSTTGGEEVYFQ